MIFIQKFNRKNREDQRVHIFNPIFSLISVLIEEEKQFLLERLDFENGEKLFNQMTSLIKGDFGEGILDSFDAMQYWQFEYQKSSVENWTYYEYLFNYDGLVYNIKEDFFNAFGFEFNTYLKVIILLHIVSVFSEETISKKVFLEYSSKKLFIKEETVEHIISILSVTKEEFLNGYKEKGVLSFENNETAAIFNFNYLKKKPIISLGDKLFIPCPELLLKSVENELYYKFKESKNSNTNFYNNIFSKVTEEFINKELIRLGVFNLPEFEYKKGQKGPDTICVFENVVIFVEIKSRRYVSDLLSHGPEHLRIQKNRAIHEGLIQCMKKKRLYQDGIIKDEQLPLFEDIDKLIYVTLSIDDFYESKKDVKDSIIEFQEEKNRDLMQNKKKPLQILELDCDHAHFSITEFLKIIETGSVVHFIESLPEMNSALATTGRINYSKDIELYNSVLTEIQNN